MFADWNAVAVIQIGLDIVLLGFLFFLILRRQPGPSLDNPALRSAEDFLAASERLSAKFDENLQEKRALIQDLIFQLEAKTDEMKRLLDRAERLKWDVARRPAVVDDRPRPVGTDPADKKAEVIRLSRDGLSPAQIARRLRLPKGAVEVILSLKQQF